MKAYQQYKRLQGIGATRLRLGFSQELFALQLGVSRSLLSKVENRQRSLPLAALAKLAALEKELQSAAASDTAELRAGSTQPAVINTAEHYLLAKGSEDRLQIKRLEHQLMHLEKGYARLGESIACIESLMLRPEGQLFEPGSAFLKMQCAILHKKQERYGLQAQAVLRRRISQCKAAAEPDLEEGA